jgi:hypothetical protein
MKSIICKCGESRCFPSMYAGTVFLECAKCGEQIKIVDNPAMIEAGLYIYDHTRKEVQEFFADDVELLKWALQAKDTQEEEEYKRKIGMTGDGNVGS